MASVPLSKSEKVKLTIELGLSSSYVLGNYTEEELREIAAEQEYGDWEEYEKEINGERWFSMQLILLS